MSRSATPSAHYVRSLESHLTNTTRLERQLDELTTKYDSKIDNLTQLIKLQHEYNVQCKHEHTATLHQLQQQLHDMQQHHDTIQSQWANTNAALQAQVDNLKTELSTIADRSTQSQAHPLSPTIHQQLPQPSQQAEITDLTDRIDQVEKLLIVTDERTVSLQSTISKVASDVLTRFDTYQSLTSQQLHAFKHHLQQLDQTSSTVQQLSAKVDGVEGKMKYNAASKVSDMVLSRLEEQIDTIQKQHTTDQHNTSILLQQVLDRLSRVNQQTGKHGDKQQHSCDVMSGELLKQQKELARVLSAKLKQMDARVDELRTRLSDRQHKAIGQQQQQQLSRSEGVAAEYVDDADERKSMSPNPVTHVQPYILYPAKLPSTASIDHLERLVRTVDSLSSPVALSKTVKWHTPASSQMAR